MSNFLIATFPATATTDLTSFTGDAGVTWTLVRGTISPKAFAAAGGIAGNGGLSAAGQIVRSNTIAPSTEVNTTVTFHYDSVNFNYVGYTCRMSVDGNSGYLLAYSAVSQKWAVWRMTSGSGIEVAEIVTAATTSVYTAGSEPVVQFKVEGTGASVSITVIVDGATLIDHFADTNAARITTAGYDGLFFLVDYAAGSGMWIKDISGDTISTGSTAITMTGPTSGTVGVASTNFTAGANGTITGTIIVTPSDSGGGGTFTPTTVSISSGTPTATFTYTPASTGAKTIGATNNGSLTNPSNITYTATSAAATAITLSGPTSGNVSVASSNFTVAANGVITGTVVVTPNDSSDGGAFTPTSVSLSSGTPSATFTYTPASTGAKTVAVTNNGSLTNPSAITYTVSTGTTRTVTINLVDVAGAAVASLTGLKWAFFANVTPDLFVAPEAKGAVETTDASGVNVISFTSALAPGATGWLTITDSDGSATTIHKAFSGPVVVA
jgi:hypothetical protein